MPYPEKSLPSGVITRSLYLLLLYLILPISLVFIIGGSRFIPLFAFYLTNTLLAFYLLRKNSNCRYKIDYQLGNFQERLNILSEEKERLSKSSEALKLRIIRYNSLKQVVQELNQSLDLEVVSGNLTTLAFQVISSNKGTCILYLVDPLTQKLNLYKTRKEEKKLVIKVKEGDIFDFWVLRHASPLLIEDLRKDFRFDLERLEGVEQRPVISLISSPLTSDGNTIGVLRLDHPQPGFFSQDDLRFLATLSGLGAVAIENSQLFQKTQDLAIHDGLTSLYTKGYLLESLDNECKRALRYNIVFSLLMLDIDLFKNYNDKFGHTAGDIVLKRLSELLGDSFKGLDALVSRFGGEEFCVILRHTGKPEALKVAEELRKKIENDRIILRRIETAVTVSIGVASFPIDASEANELIAKSDKAMYEAKHKGRNQVCSN
ncbi:MAG TPA: sensor domain-containing diguanylate cyclase [Candidatus Margulisiibacteriota bacterium]|nr:sensor domain-containing diguanylate cyclase [Candidatus Margulisiibacteriota bacterium]